MLAANLLLTILFLPGAVTGCGLHSDLFITTPKNMKALSGSCLQIPCNFRAKQEHDFGMGKIFGVWIKTNPYFGENPKNVVFNSSGTVLTYPMNITGNLSQKQCATLFSNMSSIHTDKYFFRIHSSSLRATDICNALQIRVIDTPPPPSMEIQGDLKEAKSVNISCSAFIPCPQSPPKLTLSLLQDSYNTKRNTVKNADGTFTAQIWTSVTLTEKHDGYSITCSAAYPVKEGKDVKIVNKTRILSVSYSPKNITASMSPSSLVSVGTTVTLTCSSTANPPVKNFTWFKISNPSPMNVFGGKIYSFNATEGGVYYCEATNDLGSGRSPQINLYIEGGTSGSMSVALLGGIIAIVLLICLVVSIIIAVMLWRKLKSAESSQQSLYQTGEEMAAAEPRRRTDEEEDGIHYGVIDFSKRRPNPSYNQDSGQQQETLYAQVKGSGSRQASVSPDDLYAQVRRH